jgi:hypothetical protein
MSTEPVSHDLRTFLRNVGGLAAQGALKAAPAERPEVENPVELLDASSSQVFSDPLPVAGFVDGIQSAAAVTWREHRPVYLTYVAAAAVGARGVPIGLAEQLEVLCAEPDTGWVLEAADSIPVRVLEGLTPAEIEGAAFSALGSRRENLEREVIETLVTDPSCGSLILDGQLVARPHDHRLFGVVKTTRKRYLEDESVLWRLPEGWRSPRFAIPAGTGGPSPLRYSCYLRLFDAGSRGWDFGLLRLESYDPELLDALASRCLIERQGSGARDARWDRHLGGVRQVENFLRSRRPAVFG